jgi:DNA (cytosine-5)-methyltransferase 1
MMYKVLNAYAGIGGNRKLWPDDLEITAIELNPQIAKIYQDFWPDDKVIITDAHQYILEHFNEFDFIWSSPPCPTHSKIRYSTRLDSNVSPVYPDMRLYQEVIFLSYHSNCPFVVENVVGYYDPLITPQEVGKHYFWANFRIPQTVERSRSHDESDKDKATRKGFNLNNHSGIDKKTILRNCVEPELGKHIFDCAFKGYKKITDFGV